MKTLLTGSTGFIGRRFTQKFSGQLVVTSRTRKAIKAKDEFFIESINSTTDWLGAFEQVETVIHLAGLAHSKEFSKKEYEEVNVEGTLNLARSAAKAGVSRFIFISSIGVNGNRTNGSAFKESDYPNPTTVYAKSKLSAEKKLIALCASLKMDYVIIRPTLVYGKDAPGNFGKLVKLIKFLRFIPLGAINNRKSFVSLDNLVSFISTCSHHPLAKNETFLIADGSSWSIGEFIKLISKLYD
jgi:nucleoside-diphosphate-sugar epimerase